MTTKVSIQQLAKLLATDKESIFNRIQRGELEHEIISQSGIETILIPLSEVNLSMLRRTYGTGGRKVLVQLSEENLKRMKEFVPTGRGSGQGRATFDLSLQFLFSILSQPEEDVAERLALFSQICEKPIQLEDLAKNLRTTADTIESLKWQMEAV